MWTRVQTAIYFGYVQFFRLRLLVLNTDDIIKYIEQLDKETSSLKDEALRLCWNMRGGLSYNEAMHLSQSERTAIGKIIKDNLETTKKSGLPYF